MDGVIVNFRGQCEKFNCIKRNDVNWDIVKGGGSEFWENMEWLPEGKEFFTWLIKICEEENIDLYILSAVNYDAGKVGKINWLKQNTNINKHHIILTDTGEEKSYYADQDSVLIDDFKKNCENFTQAGGKAIKYETPNMAQDELLILIGK